MFQCTLDKVQPSHIVHLSWQGLQLCRLRVHFGSSRVMHFEGGVGVHLLVCSLRQSGWTTPFVYDLECVKHVPMYIGQGPTLTYCSFALVGTATLSFESPFWVLAGG